MNFNRRLTARQRAHRAEQEALDRPISAACRCIWMRLRSDKWLKAHSSCSFHLANLFHNMVNRLLGLQLSFSLISARVGGWSGERVLTGRRQEIITRLNYILTFFKKTTTTTQHNIVFTSSNQLSEHVIVHSFHHTGSIPIMLLYIWTQTTNMCALDDYSFVF